jgi:hypothetical protein
LHDVKRLTVLCRFSHAPQNAAAPDAGPSSTEVSPALTSNSFDSHPTPASADATGYHSGTPYSAEAYYSYPDEDNVRYAEYEYTSAPWPNPIEGDEFARQLSTTTCGISPAQFVRHQYYEQPTPVPAHSDGHAPAGGAPLDEPSYIPPSASLPAWDDAALLATAGRSPVDSHGLAAMWCLLDDDAGGGSSSISPFMLDPGPATADDGASRAVGFSFDVDPWATTSATGLTQGLEGEWTIDYSLPEPMRQTVSALALALDFGPTAAVALAGEDDDDERTAPVGHSHGSTRPPTHVRSQKRKPSGNPPPTGQRRPSGAAQHAESAQPTAPSAPLSDGASRASPAPAPEPAAATDLEAVTREVGRVTVGVPRRNTRVVGGTFGRPPRVPLSPPAVEGRV